jgi:hypothetical protein
MYCVGQAFTWDIPGALILSCSGNPFVGHEEVMNGILNGKPNIKLIKKYEKLYKDNGYTNLQAQQAVEAECKRRRMTKELVETA